MNITKDKADNIILDLLVNYSAVKNRDIEEALKATISEYQTLFGFTEAEKYRNAFAWLKRRR